MDYLNKIKDAESKIGKKALDNIISWLTDEEFAEFHKEIKTLIEDGNYRLLKDSFSGIIPFGTGGRRGPMGAGTNRINSRTISESAQGVANYLLANNKIKDNFKVVIAYDTRNNSRKFAEITAEVFCGNNFKVYFFDSFRSTPELSFAVRKCNADVGVVISASHNPPIDNGFKAYWSDGGQIVAPHDNGIIKEVGKGDTPKRIPFKKAVKNGLVTFVTKDIDDDYIQSVCDNAFSIRGNNLKVVYTPLHGTGTTSVLPVLEKMGFDVILVEEQTDPDGNFPGLENNLPNPEDPSSMKCAIEKAKECGADLVLATDPDADRIGVAIPKSYDKNEWYILSGNQIISILTYFVLEQYRKRNLLNRNKLVVKTIVTTHLISDICNDFGVTIKTDLPVGFKFIGEVISELEKKGQKNLFILGCEESHGFLKGTYTRDKDAAIGSLLMAQLTSYQKREDITPYHYLQEIYRKYGYYKEVTSSLILEGGDGQTEILRIMDELRSNPPEKLGPKNVIKVLDCLEGNVFDPKIKSSESSNILIFILSEDEKTRLSIRPSGTEPKIKYYLSISAKVGDSISSEDLESFAHLVDTIATSIINDLETKIRMSQQNVFVQKLIEHDDELEEESDSKSKEKIKEESEQTLYDNIVCFARQVLFTEAASLFLFDETKQKLYLRAASGYFERKKSDIFQYDKDENKLTPWIFRHPKEIVKVDSNEELKKHPAYGEQYSGGKYDTDIWKDEGQCHSFLGVALTIPVKDETGKTNEKVIGVLKVENKRPGIGKSSIFTRDDVELLKYISNIIILAITKILAKK